MSILMGLIQGVAEFLPISSSGHLALFQAFFGMEDVEANHMFWSSSWGLPPCAAGGTPASPRPPPGGWCC